MSLIAKRKLSETWRAAVAARVAQTGSAADCLAVFDSAVASGEPEHVAAFKALRAGGCLWSLDVPTPSDPALIPSGDVGPDATGGTVPDA